MSSNDRRQKSNKILHDARTEMSWPERTASRIVHAPGLEQVFRFSTSILLRPTAVLYGSILLGLGYVLVFIMARHIGYELSGLEPLVFFGIGWLVGNIQDFLVHMITGKPADD